MTQDFFSRSMMHYRRFMVAKDEMVWLSASSLQRWYDSGCPAQWNYERKYRTKEVHPIAARGIDVHALLEGSKKESDIEDKFTLQLYDKLLQARQLLGLTILATEVRQQFEIVPGVTWTRILDVIATDRKGEPLILDYKTAGAAWKQTGQGIIPRAEGFQTPSYMYPPPKGVWKETKWPKQMLYLIAPFRGQVQFIYVKEYDKRNFLDAVKSCAAAVRAGVFPKVKSGKCIECPMRPLCFKEPGHKELYEKKRHG